ncbi:MAG: hypothetical protein AB9842_10950 [Bacteroidales bacterium]
MSRNIFKYLFLSFISLVYTAIPLVILQAQDITAKAGLDTSSILLGQQVTLKINVGLPSDKPVSWPVFADSLAPGVEIISVTKVDTQKTTDPKRINLVQSLRITSFDTGFHKIPGIPFFEKGKLDSLGLLALTNELFLTVNTIPVDTTKAIKDIKGVMSVPLTFWEIFRWVLLGLGVLAVAFGIWYYIRRKRKNKPVFVLPSRPPVPAHLVALEEFEKLRQAKLWQSGKVKEYHTKLTDIVRIYLEKRYDILAMEMTTDEILASIKPVQGIHEEALRLLREILQLADLVKFAKEQPLPLQHDNSLSQGIAFVNLTRPSIQEPAKAESQNSQEPTAL